MAAVAGVGYLLHSSLESQKGNQVELVGTDQIEGTDVYKVTATVTWTVTWTDGTNGGSIGPIIQQSTAAIRVAEGQAINTN